MKKYILFRTLRSIFSILVVVTIAFLMVYTLVPRHRVFSGDPLIQKLTSKPDELAHYKNSVLEELGYIDFFEQKDMCAELAKESGESYSSCMVNDSTEVNKWITAHEDNWTVIKYPVSGLYYAYRDIPIIERLSRWYSNFIYLDNTNAITDLDNPNLDRKIYIGKDLAGMPAVKCSGCLNKYLLYVDGIFPYVHQNWIMFNMGVSYPAFAGIPVLNVINDPQGVYSYKDITFETGITMSSPINEHKCYYKPTNALDRLDRNKFNDNYASCAYNLSDPSMLSLSFTIGIFALLFSYFIGIPLGIAMAANKGKLFDKIGLIFVTIMFSIPSLAFIYFVRYGNLAILGLPDKFPTFGANNPLSYLSPIIILGLLGISGLIVWVRRYMIDQSTSDYVKFARAKGLSQSEIFTKHILRNAIIPIAQGMPAAIIATLGGAVMTETVFAAPGMGKMLPDAVQVYNNPMIIALTFIFTVLSIFSVFAGDILVTYIDPRISLSTKGGRK
jgi:oligopeptide transport system permease protein